MGHVEGRKEPIWHTARWVWVRARRDCRVCAGQKQKEGHRSGPWAPSGAAEGTEAPSLDGCSQEAAAVLPQRAGALCAHSRRW